MCYFPRCESILSKPFCTPGSRIPLRRQTRFSVGRVLFGSVSISITWFEISPLFEESRSTFRTIPKEPGCSTGLGSKSSPSPFCTAVSYRRHFVAPASCRLFFCRDTINRALFSAAAVLPRRRPYLATRLPRASRGHSLLALVAALPFRTAGFQPAPSSVQCLDHVAPRLRFGRNSYRNLVSCCLECNSRKGDRPVRDFLRTLYRLGRLTPAELDGRLRALKDLAAGKLRPVGDSFFERRRRRIL